jgi:endonuclease/exonuclease/phosphatase family metal-dependent hydrolase
MQKIFMRDITAFFVCTMVIYLIVSCSPSINYHPPVNDPLEIHGTADDQISLVTYNIQSIFGKNESKLNALTDYINKEQYDFVLFQELFDEGARNKILNKIDKHFYKSVVSRVDYDSFPEMLFQDSGLFLMSKYPQVNLSKLRFDPAVTVSEGAIHMILNKELSLSTDFLANKSIMGSLHRLNESTHLFIFTTHVQALGSRSHKRRQYRQIREFIEYAIYAVLKAGIVESSNNMVVLLTGDFNSDAYDEDKLETLLKDLGEPRDLHQESNPAQKQYTMMLKLFNMYKRFDYIFAYDNVGSFSLKKVKIHSINATDVKGIEDISISDHLALKASILLNNEKIVSEQYHLNERDAK